MINKHLNNSSLQKFVDGEYPVKRLVEISSHIAQCNKCKNKLESYSPSFIEEKPSLNSCNKNLCHNEIDSWFKNKITMAKRLEISDHIRNCHQCKSKFYAQHSSKLKHNLAVILEEDLDNQPKCFFSFFNLLIPTTAFSVFLIGLSLILFYFSQNQEKILAKNTLKKANVVSNNQKTNMQSLEIKNHFIEEKRNSIKEVNNEKKFKRKELSITLSKTNENLIYKNQSTHLNKNNAISSKSAKPRNKNVIPKTLTANTSNLPTVKPTIRQNKSTFSKKTNKRTDLAKNIYQPRLSGSGISIVNGDISDQTGVAVSGATVTISNAATGFRRSTTTNNSGVYSFPGVPPATYRLEVEAANFKKAVNTNVQALVDSTAEIDIQLEAGAVSATVDVTTNTIESVVNTQDATIGNNFVPEQITELPTDLRRVNDLLALQPGVTRNGYVAGGRSDQANITLDGVDINDGKGIDINSQPQAVNNEFPKSKKKLVKSNADKSLETNSNTNLIKQKNTTKMEKLLKSGKSSTNRREFSKAILFYNMSLEIAHKLKSPHIFSNLFYLGNSHQSLNRTKTACVFWKKAVNFQSGVTLSSINLVNKQIGRHCKKY